MRAAASSTASGRSSRRGRARRSSRRLELRALAEERDGLALGKWRHRRTRPPPGCAGARGCDEQGQVRARAESSSDSSGAASITCSRLSRSEQQLPLADVLCEAVLRAERLGDRLRNERRVAERGQSDPEDTRLVLGHELDAASMASRVLPVPPGPVSVTRRAPSSNRESTSSSSSSRPTKELAGVGRLVLEIVFSGGKEPSPSW